MTKLKINELENMVKKKVFYCSRNVFTEYFDLCNIYRGKKAALLGFTTYAEYRLAYKMAESPKIVRKFTKALVNFIYCLIRITV